MITIINECATLDKEIFDRFLERNSLKKKFMSRKILLIGHAQHGKDTTAELMKRLFNIKFESSSLAASRIFLYDSLRDKYGYSTPEECFEDRVNHRSEWYDLICDYNKDDKSRLAKEIMKNSDMYVGMRDHREIKECLDHKVFDLVLGVYDYRKPEEPKDSFNINLWEVSDLVIPNSTSITDLERRILYLKSLICTS